MVFGHVFLILRPWLSSFGSDFLRSLYSWTFTASRNMALIGLLTLIDHDRFVLLVADGRIIGNMPKD